MAIRHSITLSTSEPNNEVGNLKIRQGDEQTQTLEVQITADGVPMSFVGYQPFFCAKLGQTAGLGIVEQKITGTMNPANGTLEYVMRPEDWQKVGRQIGYFAFRKMKNDHEWTEQFTTRDFTYNVIPSVTGEIREVKKDGSTYIWTIEDMLRLFKEYIATGKVEWENYKNDERTIWETYRLAEKINWDDYKLREKNEWKNYKDDEKNTWEKFVEDNREFLENADPGGKIILELLGGRGGFDSLGERLDADKSEVSAQLQQTTQKIEVTQSRFSEADYGILSPKISPKMIYRSINTIFVISRKPNGKGYIRFRIEENNFTTSQSAGSPAELYRVCGVNDFAEVILLKSEKSAWSSDSNWTKQDTGYVWPGTPSNMGVPSSRLLTRESGSWVEYEINVPYGTYGANGLVYKSSGSSENVDVTVDGELVLEDVNLKSDTAKFETLFVPMTPGKHVVRFTTKTFTFLTIGGFYQKLSEYVEGFSYDSQVAWNSGANKNYNTSSGAIDYAFYDSDLNQWAGSYHGGETRQDLKWLLDGEPIELSTEGCRVGNVLELEQKTNIVNKLDSYTRNIFSNDGSVIHESIFEGSMNVTLMYTNMSTTDESFSDVLYPDRKTITTTGKHLLTSGSNVLVQRNPSTNQKAITMFNNKILDGRHPEPYILNASGIYNKFYNANVDSDEPVNFLGGHFRTIHVFE